VPPTAAANNTAEIVCRTNPDPLGNELMSKIRISLVLDIEAEDSVLQSAALAQPFKTEGEPDLNAPMSITSDPVNAGHVLVIKIQNDLVDQMPGASVDIAASNVERLN
jgi:hypothetical protein